MPHSRPYGPTEENVSFVNRHLYRETDSMYFVMNSALSRTQREHSQIIILANNPMEKLSGKYLSLMLIIYDVIYSIGENKYPSSTN